LNELEEKIEHFLELGQNVIKETDRIFPDRLSFLNGRVMMNGLNVETGEIEQKN